MGKTNEDVLTALAEIIGKKIAPAKDFRKLLSIFDWGDPRMYFLSLMSFQLAVMRIERLENEIDRWEEGE